MERDDERMSFGEGEGERRDLDVRAFVCVLCVRAMRREGGRDRVAVGMCAKEDAAGRILCGVCAVWCLVGLKACVTREAEDGVWRGSRCGAASSASVG